MKLAVPHRKPVLVSVAVVAVILLAAPAHSLGLGEMLLKWGTYGSGHNEFDGQWGIDVATNRYVYASESLNGRIQVFDTQGNFLRMWGWGVNTGSGGFQICTKASTPCYAGVSGAGAGQFDAPHGVALDSSGNVYVADHDNDRIQKFDSQGGFVWMWGWGVNTEAEAFEICTAATTPCYVGKQGGGDGQFWEPYGVAVDSSGTVFVSEQGNNRVQKFTAGGALLDKWGAPGTGLGEFQGPHFLTVDGDGHVYVADFQSHRVQKFDNDGNFLRMWGWGVNDGTAEFQICTSAPCQVGYAGSGHGQLWFPSDIAVDRAGNVYVSEQGSDRVEQFDSDGNYLAQFGTQGSGDGQFWNPVGIAVDGFGDLYVVDRDNYRIQKLDGEAISSMAYLPVAVKE